MKLILTHEQADFDAVASLFAAHLLKPEALAVLPRRLNRNVRAYLTIYGDGMPFVEYADLKKGAIDSVTLVDSQTLPSFNRLAETAHIHVVDHHPLSDDINASWTNHIENTGAATTILVEEIQESGLGLDGMASTMLLLGIYEDTGSLIFASTTVRDLRACAWLLEKGASLKIAADFLFQPLSDEQRGLYNRLIESVKTHSIHGFSIVITHAKARGFKDEISTIAHKLRDLYDPAGLFVVVELNDHIQLVARSSVDNIDVSKIAMHYGGGGHHRAAAALIRGKSMDGLIGELLDILPDVIQPEKTVTEIMSRAPQIFHPKITVREAAENMRRFGHEGYPVVDQGKVIGLLTRRAVDRAMSHGMGSKEISDVMNAGNLVVSSGDSIKHLQKVMIASNWGQVPVVEKEDGAIIGIVTRTDLIKNLEDSKMLPGKIEYRNKLAQVLPQTKLLLLKLIAAEAENQKAALYVVGGFVRDLLLGVPNVDFDLVVEGDAIHLAKSLVHKYGGHMSSHRRFGTAKWSIDPRHPTLHEKLGGVLDELPDALDLVSARTEYYTHPTALPSIHRSSIKLDLHRRDFSINTLAIRLDGHHYGELLDHWGGVRDLHDRQIRVLHSLSFIDDPTRILRAVRLEQRLSFVIAPRALELLGAAKALLVRVSGERVRAELRSIFNEKLKVKIISRLFELDLLAGIHPALAWHADLEKSFTLLDDFSPPEKWNLAGDPEDEIVHYALWMIQNNEREIKSFCKRMHFPAATSAAILQAHFLGAQLPELCSHGNPSQIVQLLDGNREESIIALWLSMQDQPECRQAIDNYLALWRFMAPAATGDTLRELGLDPGPAYREILQQLRSAVIDGQVKTAEDEQKLLDELVERHAL